VKNTIVYLLHAHNFGYLPAQLAVVRKFVKNLSRIVLVVGPHGKDIHLSAGPQTILPGTAEKLGVELLEMADGFGGRFALRRVPRIIDYLLRHSCGEAERYALILHADAVPVKQIDVSAILFDHALSVAGLKYDTGPRVYTAWVAADSEDESIQQTSFRPGKVNTPGTIRIWPMDRVTPANIAKLGLPEGFKALDNVQNYGWEWCTCGILHLNNFTNTHMREKTQTVHPENALLKHKLSGLAAGLGITLEFDDQSATLIGVPVHRPQLYGPGGCVPFSDEKGAVTAETAPAELAIARWRRSKMALRTLDKANELLKTHCVGCKQYVAGAPCKACGCGIQGDEPELQDVLPAFSETEPILNTMMLTTEHCPLWKW
jgi:hypothetical protein